jgi:hypothetical protein
MQGDEPHAAEHPRLHAIDELVGDIGVCAMAPPDKDIGRIEQLAREALAGLVERGGANRSSRSARRSTSPSDSTPTRSA